jgi:hypothetical protein
VAVETLVVEPLSPELVLVSPPEVAAAARLALPDRVFTPVSSARPPARGTRRSMSIPRAAGLASVYVDAAAVTVTPLALMLKVVPSAKHPAPVARTAPAR